MKDTAVRYRSISVGYDNFVLAQEVVAITRVDAAPAKRSIQTHREMKRLIDATQGKRIRSAIYLRSGLMIISALTTETMARRVSGLPTDTGEDDAEDTEGLDGDE